MNLNKVTFAGRITRDFDVTYTKSGTATCEVGIASNRRVKRGESWEDEPTFVNVTFWGGDAERLGKYLGKGSAIYCEGRLQQDSWEDKQTGKMRYKLRVIGERWQFVGGKAEGVNGGAANGQQGGAPQQQRQPQSAADAHAQADAQWQAENQDDIPF